MEVWMKQRDSWEDTFFAYCEYWEDAFFEYCVHWCKNWEALPDRRAYHGHLPGNGGEFSDGEGLRDGEEELWLVPNLGPLHAANAPLQDRYPNHLDSIKLVQAGEHQTQVGDHTDVMLDDHLHNTRTFRIDS